MSFNKITTAFLTLQFVPGTICKVRVGLLSVLVIMVTFVDMAISDEGAFKYNANGKRDPFIPLISESGRYASDAYEASAAEDIRLEGIVWDDVKGSIAIINGEIVKEEDTIGSIKILKINQDSVIFDVGGENIKIDLNKE